MTPADRTLFLAAGRFLGHAARAKVGSDRDELEFVLEAYMEGTPEALLRRALYYRTGAFAIGVTTAL